jgi:DeoR/GlpR family transcriptional regulator of sugar metabolism
MKSKLFPEERYRLILSALEREGRISVEELSQNFGISQVTIRSDLQYLADQNLLIRTHGGAIMASRIEKELSFGIRQRLHVSEKQRIGIAAAALIQDGEAIALDASTTALTIASHIKNRRDLTVITNSLAVAMELIESPGINVLMPGGFLRRDSISLVGISSQEFLKDFYLQKAFFSAKGFSLDVGLTEVSDLECAVKRDILTKTKQLIAVVDYSKLGQVSFVSYAPIQQVSLLITDTHASPEMISGIREKGVDVLLV